MKKFSYCLLFFILFFNYSSAQEYYHVTAESGLNVRYNTDLTSKKIAKIPFGVVVEKIATMNIELSVKDHGKVVKGNWVKVKFYNYPYLISKNYKEGFVFDGFLKPMKNKRLKIKIDTITKEAFLKLKKEQLRTENASKKIKDLDSVKTLLKGKVLWQRRHKDEEGKAYEREDAIKAIITENNQKLILDPFESEVGFSKGYSGYYPEEGILVLEGGHSSDVCLSLKNGGETQTVGNPQYIEVSPKGTYRLNGYFPGQECVSYFLEKKEDGVFTFFSELNLWQDYDICYFKQFYWLNETQFIYSKMSYNSETEKEFEAYFKGEIKL